MCTFKWNLVIINVVIFGNLYEDIYRNAEYLLVTYVISIVT